MEPQLAINDKKMFYKYLDKAKIYFEYGSGGSTYQASIRPNIKKIYSVESDSMWYNQLKKIIHSSNVNSIYIEMDSPPNTWGSPGPKSNSMDWKKYSDQINIVKEPVDLILIDGRFRVACCLKCFNKINKDCFIAFDDFLDRPQYHIVLEYFDIVEKTQDSRMVILKKKQKVTVPDEIIKKYELIKA